MKHCSREGRGRGILRSKKNKSTDKYRILKDFIIELVQESVDEDALKFVKSFLQVHKQGE